MKNLVVSLAVLAALAMDAAHAGPLAPAPRIIAEYTRDFIERTGAQTLEELLDTGIIRYSLTGGQPLLVLVNGRPYATTSSDLDTLPVSAIERIEYLGGDSLGTLGGSAVRGALNIVLRSDLDGFEARTVVRMPTRDGGDGRQGSVFWGGEVGEGRMTLGVDVLRREEITAQSREYSRSEWVEGGAFRETQNVSVGGNTVFVVQYDDEEKFAGVRSVALGKCDRADGYTGPLKNPPGITSDDFGCGFAYGTIMWNTASYEQQSAILNLDHPIGDAADLRVDANFTRAESAFRYAPSVGVFPFAPNDELLAAIKEAAESRFEVDYVRDRTEGKNDEFVVGHRFVRHGNRDWQTDTWEYDVAAGVEGRLTETLGYDAHVAAFRLDGFLEGNTFVHEQRIAKEIAAGRYDLENPFSETDAHETAIEVSSLREENDFGGDYLGARFALEGSGFAIGGRDAAWTAGFEVERSDVHDITVFRATDDDSLHDVSDVLGSGGTSYEGDRRTVAGFGEMALPLADRLDLRIAARGDEADDVGTMVSWRLGAEFRPDDQFTLRSSWSAGERPPSMWYLHSDEVQGHPYIECDPGRGDPPRSCTELNPRQVTRLTEGNPELDPWDTGRVAFGAEFRQRPYSASFELYRLSRSGLPGQNSADWAMQNLVECVGADRTNCIERTGGDITIHTGYANVVDVDLTGFNFRVGGGFRTRWGVAGMRGVWRRVTSTELRIAGEEDRYPIAKDVVRIGFLARRGSWDAVWTVNFRSGYENRAGTGTFDSWTGHDLVLDWSDPLGFEGARVTAGVFNLTDENLSVDTSNPQSVDGPTEAGWGRTFFLTLNMQF